MKDSSRTMKTLGAILISISLIAMMIFGIWGIIALMKAKSIASLLIESALILGITGGALICLSGTSTKTKIAIQSEEQKNSKILKNHFQKVA